jgi:hypothetical protein
LRKNDEKQNLEFITFIAFRLFCHRTVCDFHKRRQRQRKMVFNVLAVLHEFIFDERLVVGEITSTSQQLHEFTDRLYDAHRFCQFESDRTDESAGIAGFDTVFYFRHHFAACRKSENAA